MVDSSDDDKHTPVDGDLTSSLTGSELSGDPGAAVARLVGEKALKLGHEARALLRLKSGSLGEKLAQELDLNPFMAPTQDKIPFVPLILGPYTVAKIRHLAGAGLLSGNDSILVSFSRWKSLKEYFPELRSSFLQSDEVTETATASDKTFTQSQTEESDIPELEVEKLPETIEESVREETRIEKTPVVVSEALTTPKTVDFARNARVSQSSVSLKAAPVPLLSLQKKLGLGAVVLGVIALVVIKPTFFSKFLGFQKTGLSDEQLVENARLEKQEQLIASWPQSLRPRDYDELFASDSILVRRVRAIMQGYDRGNTQLSQDDELFLRELSDPASSSWDARVMATNQLAIWHLGRGKIQDARRVLTPLLEAASTDPTTLLNAALLAIADQRFSEAKEYSSTALRLCSNALCWAAHVLLGTTEAAMGRLEEADKQFQVALTRSANNPLIYGLWLQSLSRSEALFKARAFPLLKEALWGDPDLILDSPLRAPLAGRLIYQQAIEGLKRASLVVGSQLSPGKKAFVKWIEARFDNNPLSETTAGAMSQLELESDPQSQVILAYLLQKENKLDRAIEVLSRVMPLIKDVEMTSTWPWSLSGDIQLERQQLDQAFIFYQSALSRSQQSTAAVLGLAIALRQRGDYSAASQKFAEALSVDANFMPAQLRIGRHEWHKKLEGR